MDPLSVISLAGNIVQFVTFAASLISKTIEVHNSATGAANDVLVLEKTHTELLALSTKLNAFPSVDEETARFGNPSYHNHAVAIGHLSETCKFDCNKLLEALERLKAREESNGRWKSFKIALKTILKSDEIAVMEKRIHHLPVPPRHLDGHNNKRYEDFDTDDGSSFGQKEYSRQHMSLQQDCLKLAMQQTSKIGEISDALNTLENRINKVNSSPCAELSDITTIEDQMSKLSLSLNSIEKQKRIIKTLRFDALSHRYSSVHEAHELTFSWVFNPAPNQEPRKDGVRKWLYEGDDIFWISGKPGSGKSILMKFLTRHAETKEALIAWSHPQSMVFASHFFWNAGTPMQRSRQGLLQTLLHEIFRQVPNLVETSCERRWSLTLDQLEHKVWNFQELHEVMKCISGKKNLPVKFCFFIDGLDEFQGDHLDFCLALKHLSQSSHIKLCVSSRPWNVFERSFGHGSIKKLYMHDVTRSDIERYVKHRLEQHPRWSELKSEVENPQHLIEQVTDKAAGVFLWVFLVTQQLREGLNEYDSFSDLQRRVERIPADLENFFKQILDSVDPFYHEKRGKTLLLALTMSFPVHTFIYKFCDMEDEGVNYAMDSQGIASTEQQGKEWHIHVTHQLNARTRGLLEVNRKSNNVEFLHRTVRDYLGSSKISGYLESITPDDCHLHLSILMAFTAYIRNIQQLPNQPP